MHACMNIRTSPIPPASNFVSSLKSWEFTASLSSLGHLDYFVTCDKFAHLLPHERLNYYITHDVVFFV